MKTTTIKAADGRGTLGWTDGHFTFALETRTNVLVPGVFGSSTAATAADIVACLRANPEAATEVRRALMGHGAEQAERERDEARAERDDIDRKYTVACADVAWRQAKVDDVTRSLADADKHADDLTATIERAREVARLDRDAATKANDTAKRYQTERDAAVSRERQWERMASELSDGHDALGDFREWCEQLKCDYDVECGIRSQREGELAALRSRLAAAATAAPADATVIHFTPGRPATRADVEELRRRVERLEQLTGFVPKE